MVRACAVVVCVGVAVSPTRGAARTLTGHVYIDADGDDLFSAADKPVPGNHDWADGGDTYRAVFGPPSYAFDLGGAHFVVLRSVSVGMTASPLVADETVFAINEHTTLTALDLFTGAPVWSRKLHPDGFDNGRGATGTPAYADGALFVPTQHGALLAVDALSGVERWRIEAGDAMLRSATNRGRVAAFPSAPAVAGDLLWVGGADGRLLAADRETGEIVYSKQLAAPIMSGVTPTPPMLFVTTFDGVVHAFGPDSLRTDDEPGLSVDVGGCQVGRSGAGSEGAAAVFALLAVAHASRRRCRRRRGIP